MNSLLKDYEERNTRLEDVSNKLEEQIYTALSNALFDDIDYAYNKVPELEELKKEWAIWKNFENNEFAFNMKFGNIDYSDLVKINSEMKKIGFEVGCIFANDDTYKSKNGLEITFTTKEASEEVRPSNVRA